MTATTADAKTTCAHGGRLTLCGVCAGVLPNDPAELRAEARAFLRLADDLDRAAGRQVETATPVLAGLGTDGPLKLTTTSTRPDEVDSVVVGALRGYVALSAYREREEGAWTVTEAFMTPQAAVALARLLLEEAVEASPEPDAFATYWDAAAGVWRRSSDRLPIV